MKKKMIYPLANLVAIPGRFLRNDLTFFVINFGINKTYIKWSVKTLTIGKKKERKKWCGWMSTKCAKF
jgi:hypothetical protein